MKNFFYADELYNDLGDLIEDMFEEDEEIYKLPDDWYIICEESDLEPIVDFNVDWIMENIDQDRFSEMGDDWDKLRKLFTENIDFGTINKKIPKLYYGSLKEFDITKQDLIRYIE